MTNYDEVEKKVYVCFIQEPNGRVRLLNQVQVVYDEGTSTEVSGWEQRPFSDDPIINPSGNPEQAFDGIRFFTDGAPGSDYIRIT